VSSLNTVGKLVNFSHSNNNNKRRICTRLMPNSIVIYKKILILKTLVPTRIKYHHNSTGEHKPLILTILRMQRIPITRINNSMAMATSERIKQTCSLKTKILRICSILMSNHCKTSRINVYLHKTILISTARTSRINV
jgi:hypothetical protein